MHAIENGDLAKRFSQYAKAHRILRHTIESHGFCKESSGPFGNNPHL